MDSKQLYAVIGDPVGHSLSPAMHNVAFRTLGLNAEYIALQVKPDALAAFTNDARKKLSGFNITVPHKSAILPYLDSVSKIARLSNSVNTVKVGGDGLLYGDTTDGYGLQNALKETFNWDLKHHSVTFLGCGGVVHALAFHFALCGVSKLFFLNRTAEKAFELSASLKADFPLLETFASALSDTEKVRHFLTESELVVQCTSLGLKADDPSPIDPRLLPDGILLYETIYRKTALYRAAEARGIRCANGLSMLLHQGARSFSIWTGQEAPVDVMRDALVKAYEASVNQQS